MIIINFFFNVVFVFVRCTFTKQLYFWRTIFQFVKLSKVSPCPSFFLRKNE